MEFCENAAIYLFQYHTLPSSMDCNNCLGGCYYTVKYFDGRLYEQQSFFAVLFPFFSRGARLDSLQTSLQLTFLSF